jgi:MFS family permease
MNLAPSATSHDALSAIYRKISWRILPLLLACYIFAFLDRVNIGFAKLQMMQDVGLSDAAYGFGAGIFFLGYVLFELPSNLRLVKIGARRTISRIMVLWGLTSMAMLFVHDATSFYILRFLLGVFEAGFAPGVLFFLAYWYPSSRMGGAMAIFLFGPPVAGILGGPLSTWLMTAFNGTHGLAGWQWMFLIEGLPCVLLGLIVFFTLPNKPAESKWLTAEEKALLDADILQPTTHASFVHVLKDLRVYAMGITYFCVISGMYAVSFWLPTMMKNAGVTNLMHIGFYTAIPNALGAIFAIVIARHSDRYRERRWHCAVPMFVAAVTLGIATVATNEFALFFGCMCIATVGIWVANTVFWAIPSEYLKGDVAAGAVALINTIGLLGGFVSPSIIGWGKETFGSLDAGLFVIVGFLALGSVVVVLNRWPALAKRGARASG